METETAHPSSYGPPPVIQSPPKMPPTRAEKGKANIGIPTTTGAIAPPVAIITLPDDIELEDDPDVIELEEDILDRYIALT